MNILLEEKEWYKIDNLLDGFYFIQSQVGIISYHQSSEQPNDNTIGIKDTWFKFEKHTGKDVYIKPLNANTLVSIEEI